MNRKANLVNQVLAEVVDPEKVVAHPSGTFKKNMITLINQISDEQYRDNEEELERLEKFLNAVVNSEMSQEPSTQASSEEVTADPLPRKTTKNWILRVDNYGKLAVVVQGRDMGLIYEKKEGKWQPTTKRDLALAANVLRQHQQDKAARE
jgi:hypothetical protein